MNALTDHRVMIVDDDDISADALTLALSTHFETHTFSSGEAEAKRSAGTVC